MTDEERALNHEIQRQMLERLGIEWTPGEPFLSLIHAEIERLRSAGLTLAAQSSTESALKDAEIERLRAALAESESENDQWQKKLAETWAELAQLRAELARWKPAKCGRIFPIPVAGEAVKYCAREYQHEGAHQAETGEVWVFTNDEAPPEAHADDPSIRAGPANRPGALG